MSGIDEEPVRLTKGSGNFKERATVGQILHHFMLTSFRMFQIFGIKSA